MTRERYEKVSVNVVELIIESHVSHYYKKVWVEDVTFESGGYYEDVKTEYKSPMIDVCFMGTVDVELLRGATYSDGTNQFRAVSSNTIVNVSRHTKEFTVPTKLVLVATMTR